MNNGNDELRREAKAAGDRVDAYLEMLTRIEPDIVLIDHSTSWASIAISLKRIADVMETGHIADRLHDAIFNALMAAEGHRR